MGATLALVSAPVTASRPCSGAAPPVLGGFPAAMPQLVPPCADADRVDPPGFWVVLQENVPEFVASRFWAVFSPRCCDSRRWLRYSPRSEAFTSSAPRSAAYETAQNFTQAFAAERWMNIVQPTKPPRTLLGR